MQKGDRVWVEVSRDKERGADIIQINDQGATVRFIGTEKVEEFNRKQLRPMDTKKVSLSVATKHDGNKTRLELIPVSGIQGVGRAMTFGAKKYADHNWANGFNWSRLAGSAMRHFVAWLSGEDKDPESGLSHLDHLGACVLMLIAHETEGLGNDDRRKTTN